MPAATIIVPAHLSDRELAKITKAADALGQRVVLDYPDWPRPTKSISDRELLAPLLEEKP